MHYSRYFMYILHFTVKQTYFERFISLIMFFKPESSICLLLYSGLLVLEYKEHQQLLYIRTHL